MKKILCLITLLLSAFITTQAQTDKAKQLLDEVNSKMSAYNNIYIYFGAC